MSVPFRGKTSVAAALAQLQPEPHAPLTAMIEIADRCNEVCVHCYQVQGEKGEISTDDWRKILDDLAAMGVLLLTISGGEATLRRDFLDIVRHARERRFAVKLFTNGLTMSRALAHDLAVLAVQEVQISLYSHRAEVHDGVTGVPGSWQKTVDGARHLLAEGVRVVLKSPLMAVNAPEYADYILFVSELGADYSLDFHVDPREDGDREPEQLRIDDARYLQVMRDPRLVALPEQLPTRAPGASVCGACSGNVHIEANGEIRPCTQLTVPVGNALREGVQEAWAKNEDAQALRHLTWEDLHGCRDCDLRSHCSRCFANAQVEGGDALGPYASACKKARLNYEVFSSRAPEIRAAEEVARDPALGPYRQIEPGVFQTIEDVVTAEDRERAERHWWVRPRSTELVQIRRRGVRSERSGEAPPPVSH